MRFFGSLSLGLSALFAAMSSAFLIPNNTVDSHYIHRLHKNGTHIHTPLPASALSRRQEVSNEKIHARFKGYHGGSYLRATCGNGAGHMYKFTQEAIDKGIEMFNKGCDEHELGNEPHDYYVVSGKVVFYLCNYSGKGAKCRKPELEWSLNQIKTFCGDHSGRNSGYFEFDRFDKSYGFDLVGSRFCH